MNTALAQNGGAAEGSALVHMIERVARDPSIDLSRLEKLMEMHERVVLRNAEVAFNAGMAAAQAEIQRVAPDKMNTQTRSNYVSYAAMDAIIRPVYSRLGFAISFGTEDSPSQGCIRIVCDVSCEGHVKRYHIDMPADGKGARGNDVMTRTHATGSAVTYGRRYLLGMIFNVAVGLPDDDGNAASKTTARARNAAIAELPENERSEATERAIDEWGDREAANMRNGMLPSDPGKHDADGVVWDEDGERPATPEDGAEFVSSKAQFLAVTREHIRVATDGVALAAWWNSDEQKQARRDFELTRNEFASIRDFVTARLKALKEAKT